MYAMHTPLGGGRKVDGPGRSTCLVKSRRSVSSHMHRLPLAPCRLVPSWLAASCAGRSGRRPHEGGAWEKAPARTLQHISSAIESHRRALRHPLRTACDRVAAAHGMRPRRAPPAAAAGAHIAPPAPGAPRRDWSSWWRNVECTNSSAAARRSHADGFRPQKIHFHSFVDF